MSVDRSCFDGNVMLCTYVRMSRNQRRRIYFVQSASWRHWGEVCCLVS